MCKRGHWKRASFCIGAKMRDLEGRFIHQGLQETVKVGTGKRASFCIGAKMRGGSFTRDFKRH